MIAYGVAQGTAYRNATALVVMMVVVVVVLMRAAPARRPTSLGAHWETQDLRQEFARRSAKQQMRSVHVALNIEQPGQCIRNSTPPIVRPAQFQN
ncbi:hypothetical protein ACVWXM_001367 [Bradyrhizobium sp. GM7.3]|jgi:hypothetical protein